ncbi:FAD-binding oxidoreductase [Cryomorphaceae bacterium]|nr:FAD-binding oxidoreductase [Cryomorphaceae bacterium]
MSLFSHWEKRAVEEKVDLVIIGSGIVGLSSALSYRKLHPKARIRVVERGIFPNGASTKNAGFACLGSPTELLSDLSKRSEDEVIDTLAMRYEGLQKLFNWVPREDCEYEACGGFELFRPSDADSWRQVQDEKDRLNRLYQQATGQSESIRLHSGNSDFPEMLGTAELRLEGALNPWLLVQGLLRQANKAGIQVWNNVEVTNWEDSASEVIISTSIGNVKTNKLLVCTNGLTGRIISGLDLQPARAQVLVAQTKEPISWKGTYHLEEGFYYFRPIDEHRVLLGGARHLDFKGENSDIIETSNLIQSNLELLLEQSILAGKNFQIEHRWAGIMAVGSGKKPIVRRITDRVGCAVRMGGMGVAIGAEVGDRSAGLWD